MDFFVLAKQLQEAFLIKQNEYTELQTSIKTLSEKKGELNKQISVFEVTIQKLLQEKVSLEISLKDINKKHNEKIAWAEMSLKEQIKNFYDTKDEEEKKITQQKEFLAGEKELIDNQRKSLEKLHLDTTEEFKRLRELETNLKEERERVNNEKEQIQKREQRVEEKEVEIRQMITASDETIKKLGQLRLNTDQLTKQQEQLQDREKVLLLRERKISLAQQLLEKKEQDFIFKERDLQIREARLVDKEKTYKATLG